ncbi:MAG TPA: hypothetical protein EYQ00_03495 [Dehalococcoidia bacterium]|nr:hypothetical protein [Dehalococcoidia bacterium]
MEENDNSSSALMEIQQIITESKKQFELLNDCNKQLFNMANTVDEYVIQVLQTDKYSAPLVRPGEIVELPEKSVQIQHKPVVP